MQPPDATLDPRNLRGTDSNSLLRLYDRVKKILSGPASQAERARAERAARRISQVLRGRGIVV